MIYHDLSLCSKRRTGFASEIPDYNLDKGVLIVENGDWSNKNASNKNVSITGY